MKRPRKSKRRIHAQRLAALAKARSVETKIRHLRFKILCRERSLATETEPRIRKLAAQHIERLRGKLAELLALPPSPAPPPIGFLTAAPDGRWLPLAAAARLMNLNPAHLARRCRLSLAARGLAVRVAVEGAAGLPRWFIARDLDERLAEAQPAITTTSDEGLKEGLKAE